MNDLLQLPVLVKWSSGEAALIVVKGMDSLSEQLGREKFIGLPFLFLPSCIAFDMIKLNCGKNVHVKRCELLPLSNKRLGMLTLISRLPHIHNPSLICTISFHLNVLHIKLQKI